MVTSTFINAKEVGALLDVLSSKAYAVIHELNDELVKKGFMVIPGRVSRRYFNECFYGMKVCGEEEADASIYGSSYKCMESSFRMQKSACFDMSFEDFWNVYKEGVDYLENK